MKTSSTKLSALTQEQLHLWAIEAQTYTKAGKLPKYIPLLAQANPDWFAVEIQRCDGQIYTFGDTTLSFPLMSVVKPFVLLYLLEQVGREAVFTRVGIEPSEQPYNSLAQLKADQGFPRNPMLNSGAIALASWLPGKDAASRCENLRQWLNQQANCHLVLAKSVLASVQSVPNQRNQALTKQLAPSGYLNTSATLALDTYEHVCCLAGTISDLASLGMLLVQDKSGINSQHCSIVKAIMSTCGLYQKSAHFAVEVGIPTKSGVSGAMLSVVPKQGAIACYSPPLDPTGNSVAGLFLLKQLTQALNLSIFS